MKEAWDRFESSPAAGVGGCGRLVWDDALAAVDGDSMSAAKAYRPWELLRVMILCASCGERTPMNESGLCGL